MTREIWGTTEAAHARVGVSDAARVGAFRRLILLGVTAAEFVLKPHGAGPAPADAR